MQAHDGMVAMVLAAGVGSRLDPLTRQYPKPMVPFVNRPVMEHIVKLLSRHGITRTVSNVHYLPDKVTSYFGNGKQFGVDMQFVHEPELSGDAGGVRACREYLSDSTFLVVMGDLITDMDLSYVVSQHKEKGALATLALKQVEEVERFGIAVVDGTGMITGFQEKPEREQARSNLASTGIYVFEPEIFDYLPRFGEIGFGKQIFPWLLEKGQKVLGVETWGYWSDVGTVSQYRSSTLDAIEGFIDLNLPGEPFKHGWRGEGSTISSNCRIDGAVMLGENTHIGERVCLNGAVVIGDNCLIEDGAEIQNSIIWSGTIVGATSRVKNSVIGANCRIPRGSNVIERATVEPANDINVELMHSLLQARRSRSYSLQLPELELPVLNSEFGESAGRREPDSYFQ